VTIAAKVVVAVECAHDPVTTVVIPQVALFTLLGDPVAAARTLAIVVASVAVVAVAVVTFLAGLPLAVAARRHDPVAAVSISLVGAARAQ